ncbi:MAG: segregation/condensation protein A [Lachnospiraceae bacterium]|nr:segregation/condensation protein A [Lachnospiraceae bacterium]MDY5742028.1 segregation/condensation protein A [Lachnospiraceae bacterium]
MSIPVKLEQFEGPLDLLLQLIDKNKMDIYDIQIVTITEQYMEYVAAMQGQALDVMSEFLVLAATLLEIKAKMLLPKDEEDIDEEDPREELVRRLLEYKVYKMMAESLSELADEGAKRSYREKQIPREVAKYVPPIDYDQLLSDVTLQKLEEIFHFVMKRKEDLKDPIRSEFRNIKKEERSVEDEVVHIRKRLHKKRKMSFREMLSAGRSRMETVVVFLAVLELVKTGTIDVRQDTLFDDILIEAKENL